MHDLHNNCRAMAVVPPVAIGTTGTGQVGAVLDRSGYGGVEFILNYGAITATGAVYTVTVKEGDATGSMTSVADADLLGTESDAGIPAAARVDGSTENVTKRIGYRGRKRYVQCGVKSTATAGTLVAISAVMHSPHLAPTDNP